MLRWRTRAKASINGDYGGGLQNKKAAESVGSFKNEPVWIKNIKGWRFNKVTKFQSTINNYDKSTKEGVHKRNVNEKHWRKKRGKPFKEMEYSKAKNIFRNRSLEILHTASQHKSFWKRISWKRKIHGKMRKEREFKGPNCLETSKKHGEISTEKIDVINAGSGRTPAGSNLKKWNIQI